MQAAKRISSGLTWPWILVTWSVNLVRSWAWPSVWVFECVCVCECVRALLCLCVCMVFVCVCVRAWVWVQTWGKRCDIAIGSRESSRAGPCLSSACPCILNNGSTKRFCCVMLVIGLMEETSLAVRGSGCTSLCLRSVNPSPGSQGSGVKERRGTRGGGA